MKNVFIATLVISCSIIAGLRAGESHYQRQVREQTSVSLQAQPHRPGADVIRHIIATSTPATTPAQQSAAQAATHALQK